MAMKELKLIEVFRDLNLDVGLHADHISCGKLAMTNDFLGMVKENQFVDSRLRRIIELLSNLD